MADTLTRNRSEGKQVVLLETGTPFGESFRRAAEDQGLRASSIELCGGEGAHRVPSESASVFVMDSEMDRDQNYKLSEKIISDQPTAKIFSLVENPTVESVADCLSHGASHVFPLTLGADAIVRRISREIAREPESPHFSIKDFQKFVGHSPQHIAVLERISQIKDANASVLITGESGTGKEMVAQLLHEASDHSSDCFQAVNCGAIPEHLLESELFGHKRGAFTDARADKKGLFEVCSNGTLLLDEIGELPLKLQVKLLRVLQEREIRPLGSTRTVKVNTRILAATNRDLRVEVENGRFREDLYYRLSVLRLHIPALRERPEDIPVLARSFLNKFSSQYGKALQPLSESQLMRLKTQPWQGNVRELKNSIERAVILSKTDRIRLEDLFDVEGQPALESAASPVVDSEIFADNFLVAKRQFEKSYLSQILRKTNGNVSEAARLAGKTRVEIYRYLARNQIRAGEFRK